LAINILNFGPGASPKNLRRWAQIAEELGYHFVMISDHVANTPDVEVPFPAPFYYYCVIKTVRHKKDNSRVAVAEHVQ
jgi:hypothetical protein